MGYKKSYSQMVLTLASWMPFRKLIASGFLLSGYPISCCSLREFLQRCSQVHAKLPVFCNKDHENRSGQM